jgi:hypothetical protein
MSQLQKKQGERKYSYRTRLEPRLNKELPKPKKEQTKDDSSWFCDMCFEESVEDMIQCLSCHRWVHENCAGVKKGKKSFFCHDCAL